jgi:hypothetical protein
MSHHDDERRAQVLAAIFERSLDGVIDDIARHAHDEEVTQPFVKDDLRSDSRIRAREDLRKGVLRVRDSKPMFGGLMGMSRPRLLVAPITCFQKIQSLSGTEPSAFLRGCRGGSGKCETGEE